jgi:Trypsin
MWRTTATLLGLVCLLPTEASWKPSDWIVIRHDRPDSLYLALGSQFPAVAQIGQAGDGTLIADRWILTAGHVAAGGDPRAAVRIGGHAYTIRRTIVHPQWQELGPHDIGLVELTEAVTGVTPLPLYEARDEVGQLAILVGHGDTRTGLGGPWVSDGRARGAMSKVIDIDDGRLVFRFDAPPAGADLGGAPGRGDSGGPALLRRGARAYVAGISSAGFDGENGPGTYGAVDHFTRVSDYIAWIHGTIGQAH